MRKTWVKIKQVEAHIEEHKTAYLAGVGGLTLGVVGTLIFRQRPINLVNTVAPVFNNKPVFNNTVNNGGYMRKIVRCIETDEMWPSISKAATDVGISLPKMSQHLNGHKDHVNGLHYVIEGLASG